MIALYKPYVVGVFFLQTLNIDHDTIARRGGADVIRSVFFGVPDSSYWLDNECAACKCKATTTTTTTKSSTTYTGTTETTTTTTTTTATTTPVKQKLIGAPTTKYEQSVLTTSTTNVTEILPTTEVKNFCVACLVVGLLFLLLLMCCCCWCVQKRKAALGAGAMLPETETSTVSDQMHTGPPALDMARERRVGCNRIRHCRRSASSQKVAYTH